MFLDIATGILLSIFTSWLFDIELKIYIVLLGIIFALLPDIDFLYVFFKQKERLLHSHREILHKPLIFIIFGLILFLFFNKIIGTLFILAIFWHFINDIIGIGWGVQWFWPFSKKFYKLGFIVFYKAPGKLRLPLKFLYIWKPEEIIEIEEKYGDPDWIKNIYYKWHPVAVVEFLIFIVAIISLIIYVR